MSIHSLFSNALPFNRKERFFTGTIFPGIVCKDNFKHLSILLKELAPESNIEVEWSATKKNILFYTEYNLKESLMGLSTDGCTIDVRGDTPDIVFIIFDKEVLYLFALEAKMYDTPSEDKLMEQLSSQRVILEEMVRLLQPVTHKIIHIALLPEKLINAYSKYKVPCITWERIVQLYKPICPDDYNLVVLEYALKKYNQLVAKRIGPNSKGMLSGMDILSRWEELNITCIGREKGGLKGKPFLEDIKTGAWKEQLYQWTDKQQIPNVNWFTVADFIKYVNELQ